MAPPTNTIAANLEQEVGESPENIFAVLSDTRNLLAKSNATPLEVQRAKMRLERATNIFFKKNLDEIVKKIGARDGLASYKESFDTLALKNIKADISPRYREELKKNLIEKDQISPKSPDFGALVYVTGFLESRPKSLSGGLDTQTMKSILLAEKGSLTNSPSLLEIGELEEIFGDLGYKPWRDLDLRTMRRTITTE